MGNELKVKCGTPCRCKMRCMYQFSCNFQLCIFFFASLHARLRVLLYHKMPLTITKRRKKALPAICIPLILSSMDRRRRRNRFYLTRIEYHQIQEQVKYYITIITVSGRFCRSPSRSILVEIVVVWRVVLRPVAAHAWTWSSATCSQAKCKNIVICRWYIYIKSVSLSL